MRKIYTLGILILLLFQPFNQLQLGSNRISICHRLGNGGYNEITIDDDALPAHLVHGDIYPVPEDGCPGPPTTTTTTTTTEPTTTTTTTEPTTTTTTTTTTIATTTKPITTTTTTKPNIIFPPAQPPKPSSITPHTVG